MPEAHEPITARRQTLRQLRGVPASFRLASLLLLRARKGRMWVDMPDGRVLVYDHGEPGIEARICVHDYAMARQVMAGGDVGFAEAYMDGRWSTPDLTAVLEFFTDNFEASGQLAVGGTLTRLVNRIRHVFNSNDRAGARRNIMAHYDLGNAFYALWLDPSMTYSSALFGSENMSLEQAQGAKYAAIADTLRAGPDSHLLEIGCGWGGFAEYAARERGARVTCLTISPSQRDYALKRMQDNGLNERVDIRLEDYRDHKGAYDGIASIEMFEAVGEAYWPGYFEKVIDCLKARGRAALQIITIRDELFDTYRTRTDFIQRYIFPGGMLASESALREEFARAGLRFDGVNYFGEDYAHTLRLWSRRFSEAWDEIEAMGFDTPFKNLWNFYLHYCEAGFKSGRINVGQFSLSKG